MQIFATCKLTIQILTIFFMIKMGLQTDFISNFLENENITKSYQNAAQIKDDIHLTSDLIASNELDGTTALTLHADSTTTMALPTTSQTKTYTLQNVLSTTNLNSNKSLKTSVSNISTQQRTTSFREINKYYSHKLQRTDAPMLNYIFDSFSSANKHHHHDQRYGPHFEDYLADGIVKNITVQVGSTTHLNCRISLLQDKTVSWVKRKTSGENALQLLTVGLHTYSGDSRYTMEFQYPNNWRLKIGAARKSDEGIYECQISTHPPRVIRINLHVNAQILIVDEHGAPLQEKYYEIDSTLQLFCIVRSVIMSSSVVYWNHGEKILNYDTTRGGISVRTELMEDGANSTLYIAKIKKADSGNYTCSINSSHGYTIMVHILNGESFAELHHGGSSRSNGNILQLLFIYCIFVVLQRMIKIKWSR